MYNIFSTSRSHLYVLIDQWALRDQAESRWEYRSNYFVAFWGIVPKTMTGTTESDALSRCWILSWLERSLPVQLRSFEHCDSIQNSPGSVEIDGRLLSDSNIQRKTGNLVRSTKCRLIVDGWLSFEYSTNRRKMIIDVIIPRAFSSWNVSCIGNLVL